MSEGRRGLAAALPKLRALTGIGRRAEERPLPAAPSPPSAVTPAPARTEVDLYALAAGLEDGAVCPEPLLKALESNLALRRERAGVLDSPTSPHASGLSVRRAGLPDWWEEGGNLLLAGPAAHIPDLRCHPHFEPPRGSVVVIGARSVFDHINLGAAASLVVLGDDLLCLAGAMSCLGASTVLIGEKTTATNWAHVECRNGGMILVGADGMWAHGVSVRSDDAYAIRDAETGRRLNAYGGCIVIDRHVWLGEMSRVLGGAHLGAHSILGLDSLARNVTLPANSVCVGIPARPVRSGVTWNREDRP